MRICISARSHTLPVLTKLFSGCLLCAIPSILMYLSVARSILCSVCAVLSFPTRISRVTVCTCSRDERTRVRTLSVISLWLPGVLVFCYVSIDCVSKDPRMYCCACCVRQCGLMCGRSGNVSYSNLFEFSAARTLPSLRFSPRCLLWRTPHSPRNPKYRTRLSDPTIGP